MGGHSAPVLVAGAKLLGRGTEAPLGQQVGSWGDRAWSPRLLPGEGKVPRPRACCGPRRGAGAVCSRARYRTPRAAGALRRPLLGSVGKVLASLGHAQGLPELTLCPSLCSRCDLCCCLIPCLFDDFKDVTHTCPNCKAYIYTYKRMC